MQIIIFCKNKHYFNYPPRLHLKYVKPQNVNGKPAKQNAIDGFSQCKRPQTAR